MRASCMPRVFLSLERILLIFASGFIPAFEFCISSHFLSDFCLIVVFFAVRYSSSPLSKKYHFGHIGGADRNLTFILQKIALVTTGKSKERKEKISKASICLLYTSPSPRDS